MKQTLLVLVLAGALAVAGSGCAARQARATPAPGAAPGGSAESLLAADRAFADYSLAHGAPAAFALFAAPEAVLLPNGGAPVVGPQAIQAAIASPPTGRLAWRPVHADIAQSGELGYTYGYYEFQATEGPRAGQVTRGKYTTIWRRQPDGTWRYILDIGNPGPP